MLSRISIILILIYCLPIFSQESFKLISSSTNSAVIRFTTHADTSLVNINNQKYIRVQLLDGFVNSPEVWGTPEVPQSATRLGVPSKNGNTIRVINSNYYELDGKIAPKPKYEKKDGQHVQVYQLQNTYKDFKNFALASLGSYGIMRGIPTYSVIISPIQLYPDRNVIRIYKSITFQVNYGAHQSSSATPDNFLSGILMNYNVAKNWYQHSGGNKLKKSKGVYNSVLSSGTWYKFDAPKEGIYKITYSMLSDYGIDPKTVDPRTIKIYNNGGKVLPTDATKPQISDLQQNAIMVVGEGDGRFDQSDYILFYGRGSNFWDFDSSSNSIKRFSNPFSKHNYYWITSGGAPGKRIQPESSLNEGNAYKQTYTQAFADNDSDAINFMGSGTIFYSTFYSTDSPSRTFVNKLDNRLPQYPIYYNFRVVNASANAIKFDLFENSQSVYSSYISGYGNSPYNYDDGVQLVASAIYNGNLPGNMSDLKFSFVLNSSDSKAYLDYFEISYKKELKAVNDFLEFFSKDTTSTIEYDLNNFSSSNIQVFDVTDYSNVKLILNAVPISGGEFKFQEKQQSGAVSKYIAIGSNKFLTPQDPTAVPNQDLHGIAGGAKFIIIYNKLFKDQAERLKDYRQNQAKIKISAITVDVDQIYNEFSCGNLSVTGIRNFIKYAYNNWAIKPEYVLLFGDGTYDYKNIEGHNNNFIPSYETNSLNEVNSYPFDDYDVMIDDSDPINYGIDDLSIGRITCQTDDEARTIVDKIISYENSPDKDPWRNRITFVTGDGYTTQEGVENPTFTINSESLVKYYIPPSYNVDKIYLAAYPTVFTGEGRRKPAVNQAIIDAINQGTLILNFIGHGDNHDWAYENVWNSATITQLNNTRYFFLVAATCDFGRFDLTTDQSGAEQLLARENSGEIGAFCSSRAVNNANNIQLSEAFYDSLLGHPRDTLNLPITVGKAYFKAKIVGGGDRQNDEKFFLMGDPTLRLLIPEYSADITSINGTSINNSTNTVQLKALSNTKIEGTILKPDKTVWSDYNGEGILTVFDSKTTVPLPQIGNYPMNIQGGTIYNGRVSITNGRFLANFVVPKDISYQNQNGKVVLYFYNNKSDGLGYTNQIIVGGTDSAAVNDGKGPNIDIYFDQKNNQNSYLVTPSSIMYVNLSDQTGINATGTGVGHRLEGILNGDQNNPIDLTDYYTGDIDSAGRSGKIAYPLSDLEPGDYTIQVKAWDVFNNPSTAEKDFTIVSSEGLVVKDVYNYPNPFTSNTTFTFQQNLNSPLNVKIFIYTVAGRLIKEIEQDNVYEKFVRIPWDGRDEYGDIIANGVYLYKLNVKTVDNRYSANELGKLAIIR